MRRPPAPRPARAQPPSRPAREAPLAASPARALLPPAGRPQSSGFPPPHALTILRANDLRRATERLHARRELALPPHSPPESPAAYSRSAAIPLPAPRKSASSVRIPVPYRPQPVCLPPPETAG